MPEINMSNLKSLQGEGGITLILLFFEVKGLVRDRQINK